MYPIYKTVHEELIEGGWKQCLIDMIVFYIKVAVCAFAIFTGVWLMSMVISKELIRNVSPACIQEIINV